MFGYITRRLKVFPQKINAIKNGIKHLEHPIDGLDNNLRQKLLQNLQVQLSFYRCSLLLSGKLTRKLGLYTFPQDELYKALASYKSNGMFKFDKFFIYAPEDLVEKDTFFLEFGDLVLPYLVNKPEVLEAFYIEGPYEMGNIKLSPGDTVIDCGANFGLFSAVAATKDCRVFAFEPIPEIRKRLQITANMYSSINVCPYALSDKAETVMFQENNSNLGASHMSYKGTVEAEAITLDGYVEQNNIQSVDFIKADIEGAERLMLKGAQETIRRFHPKISICTYHLPDDPAVLRELILQACPDYVIEEKYKKMYAYVPESK
jgi:FkbM family methyltransferase